MFCIIKVGVFHTNDNSTHTVLWTMTWTKISAFLPQLKEELFNIDSKLNIYL